MRRLPRLRKVCKWTGLVLSVLLLVVWVGSRWFQIRFMARDGKSIGTEKGSIAYAELPPSLFYARLGGLKMRTAVGNWGWWISISTAPSAFLVMVPLWPAVLIVGGATVLIWHRDRRLSKPGLCKQCSYDMRGLEVCPECGMKTL